MMKDIDAFWDWVQTRMDELDISSLRELERRSGFENGAIGRCKNEHKFPTVGMAEGMCRALRVDWAELWTQAGYMSRLSQAEVSLTAEQLSGLDAELYYAVQGRSEEFKKALLKTAKAWGLYEDLK
jgi:hypothetical protein